MSSNSQPTHEAQDATALEDRVDELEETVRELTSGEQAAVDEHGNEWSLRDLLDLGLTRREALAAVGMLASGYAMREAIAASIGTAEAASNPDQVGTPSERVDVYASAVTTEDLNDKLFVGSDAQYATIQGAHDDLPSSGGRLHVTPSYTNADSFPVDLTKPFVLEGDGPGRSVIDPGGTNANVLQVDLGSSESDGFVVRDVKVNQGQDGIQVKNSAYGQFNNVHCTNQGRHGFAAPGATASSQLLTFIKCKADDCGTKGYDLSSDGIAANLISCHAIRCGDDGLEAGGVQTVVVGGAFESNGGQGIDLGANEMGVVYGVYLEDNTTIEINVTTDGGLISGCRFNGTSSTSRAINVNGATECQIRNNAAKNYTSEFIAVQSGSTDIDVHRSENRILDSTKYLTDNGGTRTRSDGVIGLETTGVDLSSTTGQFEGDRARADGTATGVQYGDIGYWDSNNSRWLVFTRGTTV